MMGGEKLLITLTTGLLSYVSHYKKLENLYIYFAQLRHYQAKQVCILLMMP